MFKRVERNDGKTSELNNICCRADNQVLAAFLESNPNILENDKGDAVRYAIRSVEIYRSLGVDVDHTFEDRCLDTMKALVNAGANVPEDSLDWALRSKNRPAVSFLLSLDENFHADPELVDAYLVNNPIDDKNLMDRLEAAKFAEITSPKLSS